MKLSDKIAGEKKQYSERFEFALERIRSIQKEAQQEDCPVNVHGKAFGEYFYRNCRFIPEKRNQTAIWALPR